MTLKRNTKVVLTQNSSTEPKTPTEATPAKKKGYNIATFGPGISSQRRDSEEQADQNPSDSLSMGSR